MILYYFITLAYILYKHANVINFYHFSLKMLGFFFHFPRLYYSSLLSGSVDRFIRTYWYFSMSDDSFRFQTTCSTENQSHGSLVNIGIVVFNVPDFFIFKGDTAVTSVFI